jgi:predicted nuclease of predicted toxin-antitoxin system
VILLRHQLAPNSPDPLVAAVAEMNDAVLVSLDSDFSTLAPRAGVGRARFRTLSRIALKCSEPQAAGRVIAALSLIQHEWDFAQTRPDKRMILEIGNSFIRLIR